MSWIRRRPLAALAILALTLRAIGACVTEYRPIFPAYYYTDANLIHATATAALNDLAAGKSLRIDGTLSEQIQTAMTLGTYRIFGPRPLAIKLVNAVLGALGIVVLAWTLSRIFSPRVALCAGALVSLWPSHVFYTSQNLKEAPAGLLAYLALGAALAALASERRAAAFAAFATTAVCLLGVGLYRSYVLLALSSALLLAFALSASSRPARALQGIAIILASLLLYKAAADKVVSLFESAAPRAPITDNLRPQLIPVTHNEFGGRDVRPTSPAGITAFRKSRQYADRRWTRIATGREIGTQIYPDAEFKTWPDVIAYVPKGGFTVLFMPLPGLYPIEGKPGRFAAAGENMILLAVAMLAAAGFLRGPKTPARLGLLFFFAVMSVGAALLEFDLGSAGRHKLMYLPMLFPFASEEALRLLRIRS